MGQKGVETGIGQKDFQLAGGSRIALKDGLKISTDGLNHGYSIANVLTGLQADKSSGQCS